MKPKCDEIRFDPTDRKSMEKLMDEHIESAASFWGSSDRGEDVFIYVNGKKITTRTYQDNGWIREKTYWRDGTEEETYDGRHKPVEDKGPKMPPFIEKKERASRAKYHPTELITSIDALMNEKAAYFNGKLLPRAFYQNWQIHTAQMFIKNGMVRYAKLKENAK